MTKKAHKDKLNKIYNNDEQIKKNLKILKTIKTDEQLRKADRESKIYFFYNRWYSMDFLIYIYWWSKAVALSKLSLAYSRNDL